MFKHFRMAMLFFAYLQSQIQDKEINRWDMLVAINQWDCHRGWFNLSGTSKPLYLNYLMQP